MIDADHVTGTYISICTHRSLAFLFRLYQPRYWYLPVVDIFRRLLLTSGIMIVPHVVTQLLVAFAVSVSFMVVFREWKPYYEVQTDALAYVCGM